MKRVLLGIVFASMATLAAEGEDRLGKLAANFLVNKEVRKEEIDSIAELVRQAVEIKMTEVVKVAKDLKEAKANLQDFIDKKSKELETLVSGIKDLKPYITEQHPEYKDILESVI